MKKLFLIYACLLITFQFATAQNVGIGTDTPQAALDVTSTNNGLLPPRMSCLQRNSIVRPAAGLIIYCTDCAGGEMQYYNGSNWMNMTMGIGSNASNSPSVKIGTQIWSAKNLDVTKYRNGDPIPQVTDPTAWSKLTTGAWCWYNNDSTAYAATYGRLYNWYAVNDSRGLAPQGWHIPTDAEWNKLVKFIDAGADTTCLSCSQSATAGQEMKSITGWNGPNSGATNSIGFDGNPGGLRNIAGTFINIGNYGIWWSSSENGPANAWSRYLVYNDSGVGKYGYSKTNGFSVRCLKD